MRLAPVSLEDKYDLRCRRILLNGTQAVVRLALMQAARDRRMGKNTAGYVTGYRGSPLGALDQQFWRAEKFLKPAGILFQPAINEELAATAMWGAQQAEMRGEGRYDGVFGIWYGKGPGVDRAGDALKHANLAGTSPWGGVLALMGDDHTCESSTTAHQSEFAFVDAMIPVLAPADVQEVLDYGLFGLAMSRFAGLWVGLKCVKDAIESTAVVDGAIDRVATMVPGNVRMPPGGLNIRPHDHPLRQEARLHEHKLPAALAFIRVNAPDRMMLAGGPAPKIGIVTAGKSYLDVRQALDALGIDEVRAANLGIRLLKLACTWPLEPNVIRRFADGLAKIVVVEEKRGLVEGQLKEILYGIANAPQVVGKHDEAGAWLLPSAGALDANRIAIVLGQRIFAFAPDEKLGQRLAALRKAEEFLETTRDIVERAPYFCPGCPHNTSTVVPEGSRAYAGIGCHYMAQSMDRHTEGYTQMGGEGANWVGEAPFSKRGHVFQNIGDGTYNHSGILAIRAAAAAGVNITYKILFNDAVAMTGGQPMDGGLNVPRVAAQVIAEGAGRVVILSEAPQDYPSGTVWPFGVSVVHRDELDAVQDEMARVGGLSVIIYDQTCAAEKRRRRKRGLHPDPDRRVVINELVCEGCGDCGEKSNCVSIVPVETEFGRKRAIDQSSCNKDFSCLKGFCPSFVTVHGAVLRKPGLPAFEGIPLPEPKVRPLTANYGILVSGIGGTGVVTIGALLAMAAHIEGKAAAVIDMAGLAQKGGAVTSHVRLAPAPGDIKAIRVSAADADAIISADLVAASSARSLAAIDPGRTWVFLNSHETPTGDFTRDPDMSLPVRRMLQAVEQRAGVERARAVEATRLAAALLGDTIGANVLLLGYAWQSGAIPLSAEAIERAIELNAVDVAMNKAAFRLGRRAAADPAAVARLVTPAAGATHRPLDDLVARRKAFLTAYQDAAYAERYAGAVAAVRLAEERAMPGRHDLSEAVARNLFKLMAIKDEYEVARLYSDGTFLEQLRRDFAGWQSLEFHLAPPVFAERDARTGHLRKSSYRNGTMRLFRFLARVRRVRGTILDPFRYSPERRLERRLLADYEDAVETIVRHLNPGNQAEALALAQYPEKVRGYGHVREAALARVAPEAAAHREALLAGSAGIALAAE
ncbi:MAG TPA: indolepyruvate ferredoxin oxidoreductase family protein [Bauldia sp.]|nr:indolepyruvate ferredoxin oxidoreductase family protein [Bauldia sp.]